MADPKQLLETIASSRPHKWQKGGAELWFPCPAHGGTGLTHAHATATNDRILLRCFSCNAPGTDIAEALGLTTDDLFVEKRQGKEIVAEYDYLDEQGNHLFQVVRLHPKSFLQRHRLPGGDWVWNLKDVRRVLYRLPELLAAKDVVYLVEGEKDADRLAAMGVVATTSSGGAERWRDEYADSLVGKRVVIVADDDEPGAKHASLISQSLSNAGVEHKIKRPAAGKDVSDHLDAGLTLHDLVEVTDESSLVVTGAIHVHEDHVFSLEQGGRLAFQVEFTEVYKERGAIWGQIAILRSRNGKLEEHPFIGPDRVNIMRGDRGGYDGFVAKVADHYTEFAWSPLFQDLKRRVLAAMEGKVKHQTLRLPIGDSPGQPFLSHPFLAGSGTTVIYGEGGTGKSVMALALGLELASGVEIVSNRVVAPRPIPVLYVDWEDSHDVLYNRAAAIASAHSINPLTLDKIYRVALEDVLAKQVRGLLTVIEQEKIGLVIVDSLGQACGGDINTAESVIRMTNAIRKLGVPVLGIHHSNKQGLPYGSVYIRNHARLMWQAQARPVEGDPMGYVYLDNEKASHVPKQETQYQTVRWANDELYVPQRIRYERTTFDLFPKADEPPTAAPITVSEACLSFLRISAGMKFTPLEVWEQATFAGEVKLDTVERKLRELAEDKQIEKNNARPLRYWVEEDYELPDPY